MKKKLIICLVLIAFVLDHVLGESAPRKYCTKRQALLVIMTTCPAPDQNPKRSFFHSKSDVYSKRDQYLIWRRLFNIGDNTTVTIPEASFQLNLLFGRCNDNQKQADLKNLLEMYRDRDYRKSLSQYSTGGRSIPNYDASDESPALMRYRREVQFTDECCDNPCAISQIKQYCPKLTE